MTAVVQFQGILSWDKEEEKSQLGGLRRKERKKKRKERKKKRKEIESTGDEQRMWVLSLLLDPDPELNEEVLEVVDNSDVAWPAFDSMIKKIQINTREHPTRRQQLSEFRTMWARLNDDGKAEFDEHVSALHRPLEKKFGPEDSESSGDEAKARGKAKAKEKFEKHWFDVDTTEALLATDIGRVVVQNNQGGTFTARKPIFKGKSDEKEESDKGVKTAAGKRGYISSGEDNDEKGPAAPARLQKKQKGGKEKMPPKQENVTQAETEQKKPAAKQSKQSAPRKSPPQKSRKEGNKEGAISSRTRYQGKKTQKK